MADGSNLKAKIGMDTGDFEKGAKKVTKAAQDMGKEIGSSLGEVGRNLGIDTGLLGELSKNISNATTLFKGMATAGGTAASSLTRAMTTLGGAIAGLGLTAAIAGFRELNNQANLFRNTVEGANLELESKAFKDTFRQAMEDQLGYGQTWAGFVRNASEAGTVAGGTFFSSLAAVFKSPRIGGNAAEDLWSAITGVKAAIDASKFAKQQGEASRQFQQEINKILDERTEKMVSWQQMYKQISEAEREAVDVTSTKAEREAAHAEAVRLVNQYYGEQIAYAQQLADAMTGQDVLAPNSKEETQATAVAVAEVARLQGEMTDKLKTLDRMYQRIEKSAGGTATSVKETAEATALTLEAATQLLEKKRALADLDRQNEAAMAGARLRMDGSLAVPGSSAALQGQAQRLTVPAIIKPVIDTEAAQKSIIELSSVIESGVAGMSAAIGDLIGNLLNGENAWGSFAQAGISVVADMMATVGKAFIAEGVGVMAADAALKFGAAAAPAAIAGGAAMVAIAAAMKTTMANAASSWSGGYSAPVASSAYTPGTSLGSYGREMEIKVTGTLTADGSKLKAVLNNEDYRTSITT